MRRFRRALDLFCLVSVIAIWLLQTPLALSYPQNSHYGQIIPNALNVTIYDHKIAGAKDADAWTLVTDGLKSVGQDEIVLTVLNPKKASYKEVPHDVILFFKAVYDLAKDGKTVRGGGFTRFGGQTHLVAPQFQGVIYLNGSPPDGVLAPIGSLIAIPVTSEELEAFDIGGPLRVTGHLSVQTSYFPYPYWCDPNRTSTFSASDIALMRKEPLSRSSRMPLDQATMSMSESGSYQFTVPENAQQSLSEILSRLPARSPILFWLGLDPNADAELTWSTSEAVASAAPGSKGVRVAGSFVLIIPGVEKSEFGPFYDGFVAMLTNDQWKQFREAVNEKRALTLKDGRNSTLNMTITKTSVTDVTARSFTKSSRWLASNLPAIPELQKATEPASTELVVLMNDDQVIKQSITTEDLAGYIKNLQKAVTDYFSSVGKGIETHELILQTHVGPGRRASYKIFHRPAGIPNQIILDLQAHVEKVEPADTINPLDFELVMRVWR